LQLGGASPKKNGILRLSYKGRDSSFYGSEIWENHNWDYENPIMNIDKVKSPLLMFHNKGDRSTPFEQAIELFISMWRLGKKAWLLQYDGEVHSVIHKKNNFQDLTVRVTQFFDHYLKGAPAPIWMTRGIDARMKGIETGLELDKTGVEP
jgi:dipeptidyl aminopeptidase/acylaminoacyl peptidase